MPRRYDLGEFESPERLENGFLRCDAKITRVGVFNYLQSDGTTRKELRLPEDVFKQDSLRSFADVPLTNDHPREALTSKNTRKFQVGHISDLRKAEQFVAAKVFVTDAEAVTDIDNGKTQLSCGYDCDLEFKAGVTRGVDGVPDGLRYDAVQRNIVGNHVALVSRARAGAEATLHLDSEDAIMVKDSPPGEPIQPQRNHPMKTIKIDGVDYEVSEQAYQAITKVMARTDEATEKQVAVAKLLSEEKARADKAEEDFAKEKKMREDAASPEKVQELVDARVLLERHAEKILGKEDANGKEFKFDVMTNSELQRAIVLEVSPDAETKFDAGDDVYKQARFDAAVESFEAKPADNKDKGNPNLNRMRTPTAEPNQRLDAAGARDRMIARNISLGQEPITVTVPSKAS